VSTDPIDPKGLSTAPRLAIVAMVKDEQTGAVWTHQDLELQIQPYAYETHVSPLVQEEHFGDVESWCAYVQRFGQPVERPHPDGAGTTTDRPFLTWDESGLDAVLDYHGEDGTPDRCAWNATHAFTRSREWLAWGQLASGRPYAQRDLIEKLEDLAPDIFEPDAATLVGLLRTLRATASSQADTELLEDGSTRVVWKQESSVKNSKGGEASLPPEFKIRIPVLKGHVAVNADGKRTPVLYELAVKVRVSADEQARLAFRLTLPGAERTLEAVYEERVAFAKSLLGEQYPLYRSA
jgi:hypothetical protein